MREQRLFAASDEGLRLSVPRLLFAFLGAPVVWALHLVGSYFLITLDCITPWSGGVWSVLAFTALSALGSGAAGWVAWSDWRRTGGGFHPSEREWRRFLLLGGMAASLLFTAVIIATGVVPLFLDVCA